MRSKESCWKSVSVCSEYLKLLLIASKTLLFNVYIFNIYLGLIIQECLTSNCGSDCSKQKVIFPNITEQWLSSDKWMWKLNLGPILLALSINQQDESANLLHENYFLASVKTIFPCLRKRSCIQFKYHFIFLQSH